MSGPRCSKYCQLNELVYDKLLNCYSKGIFKCSDILAAKMLEAIHICSAKYISVFAIFQDKILNVTLANIFC